MKNYFAIAMFGFTFAPAWLQASSLIHLSRKAEGMAR
jgi:hypothetical protein